MSSIQQEVQNLDNPTGTCPRCGEHNLYTNLACTVCGARLPWADAITHGATNVTTSTHSPLSIATARVTVNHAPKQSPLDDARDALRSKTPLVVLALLMAGGLMGIALVGPYILRSDPAPTNANPTPTASTTTVTMAPSTSGTGSGASGTSVMAPSAPVTPPADVTVELPNPKSAARPMSKSPTTRQSAPQPQNVRQVRAISYKNAIDTFANDIRSASTESQLYTIRGQIRDLCDGVIGGTIQAEISGDGARSRDNGEFLSGLGILQKAIENKLEGNTAAMEQCLNAAQYGAQRTSPQARHEDQIRFNNNLQRTLREDSAIR